MTFGTPDDSAEQTATREMAREKAKLLREQHRKQERRGRWLLKGGITVVVVAIVAVVAVSILNTIRPPGPGPLNMLSDGILIGKKLEATPTAALQPNSEPVATVETATSDVVAIKLYIDYLSPEGGEFAKANADQMETWLNSGAATVEVHPISLLNSRSQGTQYSTRAANAAGCVANYDPNLFFTYNTALLTDQPKEATGGLTDQELLKRATSSGITDSASVKSCITDIRFKNWVKESTDRALAGKLPSSDLAAISDPWTVLVNGVQYTGAPADDAAFAAFVVQAAGQQFNDDTASTATPTPAPTDVAVVPTETASATPTATATP